MKKQMVKANSLHLMGLYIMVFGKMIYNQVMEFNNGLMGRNMKECIKKDSGMEKENIFYQMELHMKVIGAMEN